MKIIKLMSYRISIQGHLLIYANKLQLILMKLRKYFLATTRWTSGSELANVYLDLKMIWLAVYNFMMPSAYNLGLMVSNLKSYLVSLYSLNIWVPRAHFIGSKQILKIWIEDLIGWRGALFGLILYTGDE